MANFIFTVSEVNGYVKKVLEAEDLLQSISIRGEVSNCSKSISNHVYFTLKDELASVQCVWFSGKSKAQAINLQNGNKIKIVANVTLYIKGGTYQLIIKSVQKDGTGSLYENFEKLKKELREEGLFDEETKKSIPQYPKVIGVITSEHGAAIQDIKRVLNESWGNITMRLYPVSVQGENAANQMIQAVKYFNDNNAANVIIIGRGGGSFEDLNSFNDEYLIRELYKSKIPTISAVGHETDFTLCDFVCDVREATPSTAAKRAVPDKDSELEKLINLKHLLTKKVVFILQQLENRISEINTKYNLFNPKSVVLQARQELDMILMRINNSIYKIIDTNSLKINENKRAINALNPTNTLKRGYAIIKDNKNNILSNIIKVKNEKEVNIQMKDGSIKAKIMEEKNE